MVHFQDGTSIHGGMKKMAKHAKNSLISGALFGFFSLILVAQPVRSDEPPKSDAAKTAQAGGLNGTWILEKVNQGKDRSMIGLGWFSTITMENGKFTVSRFYQSNKSYTGTYALYPQAKAIDLTTDAFDFAELGAPMVFPVSRLKCLYDLKGDRLILCFRAESDSPRPTSFAIPENDERFLYFVLNRAPASFKGLPEKVAVQVVDPAGKPVQGAKVMTSMQQFYQPGKTKSRETWTLVAPKVTDEKGLVQLNYEELGGQGLMAWQKESDLIAVAATSPWLLSQAPVTKVTLQPECQTRITVSCPGLDAASAKENIFHTNVQNHAGQPIQLAFDTSGNFSYPLPPGDYTVMVYGRSFRKKTVSFSVPAGKKEYTAPEIVVEASKLPGLVGKPAPTLQSATGWKGEPVDLASLKGKVVLLEFWGYWCGPCVGSMPVLFALHDEFKDKDLVIVGIHIDIEGDVPDAATLDKKIAMYRKEIWKGRDLPFSVGLFNGIKTDKDSERGAIAQTYGIQSYPTTILIDRAGKVVGEFHAREEKSAIKAMEKVLNDTKK